MSVRSEEENKDIIRVDYWNLREELTTFSKAMLDVSEVWGKCLADLNGTDNVVQITNELRTLNAELWANLAGFVQSIKGIMEHHGCDMAEQSITEAVERSDAARAAWVKSVNEEYDND